MAAALLRLAVPLLDLGDAASDDPLVAILQPDETVVPAERPPECRAPQQMDGHQGCTNAQYDPSAGPHGRAAGNDGDNRRGDDEEHSEHVEQEE